MIAATPQLVLVYYIIQQYNMSRVCSEKSRCHCHQHSAEILSLISYHFILEVLFELEVLTIEYAKSVVPHSGELKNLFM